MKKKLLSVLLAVTLVATALTGCGDEGKDKDVESVENDDDADVNEESDDKGEEASSNGVQVEGPDVEDDLIEIEGEVTTIEDGDTADEDDTDDTVVEDDADDVVDEDADTEEDTADEEDTDDMSGDKDWSTAYDDFFSREGIIPEKTMMTMGMEMDGLVFDLKMAGIDDDFYMAYDFGTAALDMYAIDGKVYAHAVMGADEVWNYAAATEEELSEMFTMTDTSFTETTEGTECTYREEVEEDGVIYDVLDVVVEEDGVSNTVGYYVNRETQVIEKCVVVQDGVEVEVLITAIDSIELPAEAADATEATMEDISGLLIGVMLVGMGAEM